MFLYLQKKSFKELKLNLLRNCQGHWAPDTVKEASLIWQRYMIASSIRTRQKAKVQPI